MPASPQSPVYDMVSQRHKMPKRVVERQDIIHEAYEEEDPDTHKIMIYMKQK